MTSKTAKLQKRIFEARYEKGYRYLDRCGEAMLILEEVLPDETGQQWMPEQLAPTGAVLKCPALDVHVAFDTHRLSVVQDPAGGKLDFGRLSRLILATIGARFDLRSMVRFGCRRNYRLPVDSVEDAEGLSLKVIPLGDWPKPVEPRFRPRSAEVVVIQEDPKTGEGYRLGIEPEITVAAPARLDDRLKIPARLLPQGQKEAVIEQQRRRRQRDESPVAGVTVDVDYYLLHPPSDASAVIGFLQRGEALADELARQCLGVSLT